MFDVNPDSAVVGLSLSFQERFAKLDSQANNITIEYKRVYRYEGKKRSTVFEISNVCGYVSPANIYNELSQYCDDRFFDMAAEIKFMRLTNKIVYLMTLKNAFENLLSMVAYKQLSRGLTIDGGYDFLPYTEFTRPTFIGSRNPLSDDDKIDILCNASKFADSFVRVIKDAISKLNNLIFQLEMAHHESIAKEPYPEYNSDKFQTQFTVAELAYWARLFVEEGYILVPEGKNEAYFRSITNTLSSKNAENISPNSFKNKFHNPEQKAIENIRITLLRLLQRVNNDR